MEDKDKRQEDFSDYSNAAPGKIEAEREVRQVKDVAEVRSVAPGEVVTWVAKEYIAGEKNTGWYVGMVLIGLVLAGLAAWLRQWTFIPVVVVSVVALWLYVSRPPRDLNYKLDDKGLYEGNKLYSYESFKSFSVMQDGNNFSIMLTPKKRLATQVRVYFPQDQGEKIVDMFGAKLSMVELKLDLVDKVVKFLRI